MLEDYSKYSELNRVPVIDVPITGTNMADCINFLAEHIDELHGEYICVSNAHTSVLAHDDPSYWDCQAESVMSVPDGKPLSVVGRKSFESMDRVTGPDLMREIFEISSQYGWSHYFYGNEQKNLDALRESLNRDFPGLKIVGMEPSVFVLCPTTKSMSFLIASPTQELTSHGLLLARPVKKFLCTSSREGHSR